MIHELQWPKLDVMGFQVYDDHYESPFGSDIYVADGMIYDPIKYISDFFQ